MPGFGTCRSWPGSASGFPSFALVEVLATAVSPVVAKECVASRTLFLANVGSHGATLLYVELVSLEFCFYQGELNAGLGAPSKRCIIFL